MSATLDELLVVYGPTAEWGDGSGPLFYTDSLKSAGYFVREERRMTVDHAAQIDEAFARAESHGLRRDYDEAAQIVGWPTNQIPYWLGRIPLADTGYSLADFSDDDELLEAVNER